jgi:hypothetical protein
MAATEIVPMAGWYRSYVKPASLGVSRELLILEVAMRQRTSGQDSVGLETSCPFSLSFGDLGHLEFAGRGCADNGADEYCEKVSNVSVTTSQ